jgi:hypothetical protein
MTSSTEPIRLTLEVNAGPDATPEEIDLLTRQLLADLRQMELESADLLGAGPPPDGTKAVDPVTLGALAVAVLPSVIPKMVDFVQAWSLRGQSRSIKFKGKIGGQDVEFEGPADELKVLMATLAAQARVDQPITKSS